MESQRAGGDRRQGVLGDAADSVLPARSAAFGHQPQVGRKVSAILEVCGRSHPPNQARCRDLADAGNREQFLIIWDGLADGFDLAVESFDLRGNSQQGAQGDLNFFQNFRRHSLDSPAHADKLAGRPDESFHSLGEDDAEFQEQGPELIDLGSLVGYSRPS